MRCSESIVAGVRISGATFLGDLVFSIIPWFDAPPLAKPRWRWRIDCPEPMSPLFPCCSCGVQIERSIKLYRERKGKVMCSTCQDRDEATKRLEADGSSVVAPKSSGSEQSQGSPRD